MQKKKKGSGSKGKREGKVKSIKIGNASLSLVEIREVSFDEKMIDLDAECLDGVRKNRTFLKEYSKRNIVYGLNTGFGPMSHIYIGEKEQRKLQINLIRSHALGQGNPIDETYVRAIILVRLKSLVQGKSGVSDEVCRMLEELLNKNILPIIPEHGSVGASGDLVQLAHLAQVLIGEGRVLIDGRKMSTKQAFRKMGIRPLQISLREGLALMNGTAAMTGFGAINIVQSKIILYYGAMAAALLYEITESSEDYFSRELSLVRPHKGQEKVSAFLRETLRDSKMILRKKENSIEKEWKMESTQEMRKGVQEIYSIRCAPQILGPIMEIVKSVEETIEVEANSVTDNPIAVTNERIIHGGNFHGDYVSVGMDMLKMAIIKLSILSERRLNYLLNERINKKLPPFLNKGKVGLDLGMQGIQFVATSTVAENQSLSVPVSVHSISCNGDNQDVVSMGTNAALMTKKIIRNTFEVLAIELIALSRAVDILGIQDKMSSETRRVYEEIKKNISCSKKNPDEINQEDVSNIIRMMGATSSDILDALH